MGELCLPVVKRCMSDFEIPHSACVVCKGIRIKLVGFADFYLVPSFNLSNCRVSDMRMESKRHGHCPRSEWKVRMHTRLRLEHSGSGLPG